MAKFDLSECKRVKSFGTHETKCATAEKLEEQAPHIFSHKMVVILCTNTTIKLYLLLETYNIYNISYE